MTPKSVRFEGFTVDLERMCLIGPSGQAPLRHKSFEVLRYLLAHAGRVVPKEEVLDAVWPEVTVGEESLTQCISEIRRALCDTDQRLIKTIPRRGYVFDAPAAPVAGPGAEFERQAEAAAEPSPHPDGTGAPPRRSRATVWRAAAAAALCLLAIAGVALWRPWTPVDVAKPSLAVLPYAADGDEDGQAALADGLTDDLIASLSRLSGLTVVPRTTAFLYRDSAISRGEIARRLGVRYLLAARVARNGENITVRASLWDSRKGSENGAAPHWQVSLSRKRSEIFDLQATLKARIARVLAVRLSDDERAALRRRPTRSFEAYVAYLEAERLRNIGTWPTHTRALSFYDKALALDADFVEAHIGNARVAYRILRNTWLIAIDHIEARRRLDESLRRVFSLDARNADGLGLRAQIALWLQQHDLALQIARSASAMHPDNAELRSVLAGVLIAADRPVEGRAELQRALDLAHHPSPELLVGLAWHHLMLGDAATALALAHRAEIAGSGPLDATLLVANAYAQIGDLDKARAGMRRVRNLWPRASVFWYRLMLAHYRNADRRERVFAAFLSAGMPEKPHGFAGAPADRLTAADLQALFGGRTVRERGISPSFAWGYETIWGTDGSLRYRLNTPTPLKLNGRWSIDGDKICFRYEAVAMGRPYCVHLYRIRPQPSRDGAAYVRADMFGIFRFTAEPLGDR